MLKKLLYIIVALLLGFVVFYISWRNAYTTAVINKGNKALEEENYEFFCKFLDYYETEPIFVEEYKLNNNTTTVRAYNVYSKNAIDKDKNKVSRSGVLFLVYNLNTTDVVKIDTEEPSTSDNTSTDEENVSKAYLTSNTGSTTSFTISTYGYDTTPIFLFTTSSHESKEEFVNDTYTTTPTSITHLKMADSEGTVFFDNDINVSLEEHNEEDYWKNLVDAGKAGIAFTSKESRSYFTFSFPEMNRVLIVTSVAILILVGLGLFIFWPKKSYVPTEEVDRETYSFASTEEKEKYALAKVARNKKEKEDRENRYRNVRKESNLENISDEAIEESLDKENTAEAALAEDAKLEALENKEETKEEE